MAVGRFKFYDKAIGNMANGTIDLDTDTFNIRLFSSASNANTLTAAEVLADLTNELGTANGYTAGGINLSSVTFTRSGNIWTMTSALVQWTAAGGSIVARLAAISKVGTANAKVNPLLCVALLDTTPADVTATDTNIFKITPHASGIFTMTGNNTD